MLGWMRATLGIDISTFTPSSVLQFLLYFSFCFVVFETDGGSKRRTTPISYHMHRLSMNETRGKQIKTRDEGRDSSLRFFFEKARLQSKSV